MHEKHLFEYAVVRLVPRVEREEFLNVGVILYCQPLNFLAADFDVNKERLACFACNLSPAEIDDHLAAFETICSGGDGSGPIGKLPPGERFRWLTAPRSTVMQTSAVHTGLTSDPAETLSRLLTKLVK